MSKVFEVEDELLDEIETDFFSEEESFEYENDDLSQEQEKESFLGINYVSEAENILNLYIKEIAQIPLLTREEEMKYGKLMKKGQRIEEEMNRLQKQLGFIPTLSQVAEKLNLTEKEVRLAIKDSKLAFNKLVTSNLRLVVSIAKKHKNKGLPFDDLIQEGNLGLIRAVQKFDPDKGYKFSTYATWWIKQAVSRGVAAKARAIRLPLHIVDVTQKVKNAIRKMTQENGKKPSTHDIAKEINMPIDKLMMISDAFVEPVSMDMKLSGEDDVYVKDLIQSTSPTPEDLVMKDSLVENINKALKTLPEKERSIISMRYGLDDGNQKSLQDIADVFGVTRERVRQIVNSAMKKLRTPEKIKRLSPYVA